MNLLAGLAFLVLVVGVLVLVAEAAVYVWKARGMR